MQRSRAWWHTPLILALQRQVNLCEFSSRMVYKVNSKTARKEKRRIEKKQFRFQP